MLPKTIPASWQAGNNKTRCQ